ncbi:DUF3099 domain-containing protein [Raineyella fluvialis]|uniref:DUF3099 domain-containing protein n=1 Tax=Raineyella fluvialis TaxID=2662261 RepID=UPI00188F318B|nr:DUF3099 domain-containing protein [Raineyella fluvialis]
MARSGGRRGGPGRHHPPLITSAPHNPEEDLNRRQMQYLGLMSLRVICFVAAVFLHGVWRWVAVAGAAVLPAIAVVIANAVDLRLNRTTDLPPVPPEEVDRPALENPETPPVIIPGESEPGQEHKGRAPDVGEGDDPLSPRSPTSDDPAGGSSDH